MPNLSRPDDFYLLHQSDFCTLFDRVNNRPKAVYATVQGPVRSMDTKLFSIKRVDPRVHLTNSGESPLFRPELATTRSSAVECWISTNMVSIRGRGYEIFVTQILPKLIGNRKVNIVIIPQFSEETNTEVTAIKFVMTIVDKKEWSVFQVQVSDMSQLTNPGIDFKSWFARHHSKVESDDLVAFRNNVDPMDLWRNMRLPKRTNPRYHTNEPHEFLCKNSGQYDPWWTETEDLWDRCDEKPDRSSGNQCFCDSDCLKRKDCCTDYLQSCSPNKEPEWKDRECFKEEEFVCPGSFGDEPMTLIISTDGFRKHYFERGMTPNIEKLRECGSTAKFMQPSYPTKTFPNHYTLVTGLHPSQHGIVDNDWYDWKRKAKCSVFTPNTGEFPCNVSSNDEHWWKGDPFWNTVERHDKISGTLLWPGNELVINGQQPTYHWNYDEKGEGPFAERVYGLLKWMNLPAWDGNSENKKKSRPNFMTLYLDEPDKTGHKVGPYDTSGELDAALKRVDTIIGMLLDGIHMYGLDKCINIVLTTDHGMEEGVCDNTVALAHIADEELDDVYIYSKSTTGLIGAERSKAWGSDFDIRRSMDKFQCSQGDNNLRAFDKYLLPKRLHYGKGT